MTDKKEHEIAKIMRGNIWIAYDHERPVTPLEANDIIKALTVKAATRRQALTREQGRAKAEQYLSQWGASFSGGGGLLFKSTFIDFGESGGDTYTDQVSYFTYVVALVGNFVNKRDTYDQHLLQIKFVQIVKDPMLYWCKLNGRSESNYKARYVKIRDELAVYMR